MKARVALGKVSDLCATPDGLRATGPSGAGPAALHRRIVRWERGCCALGLRPRLGRREEAVMTTRADHREVSPGAGSERATVAVPEDGRLGGWRLLKILIGSGDKIGLFILPFLLAGLVLNIVYPTAFTVGGPPAALRDVSIVVLIPGLAMWAWSVVLILRKVPRGELITNGPYSIVKHPLYTSVALLVLPWLGFLFNTWLGALIGTILYIGSRIFAPAEEAALSKTFGASWDEYCNSVKMPWL